MVRGFVAAFVVLASVGFAHAEKRLALVIGNSAYTTISALANPTHDAALMAQTLKSLGFEVASARDVDLDAMARAVRDFGEALRSAGKDAVGLFYFAGHGLRASGANYLLPVGAQVKEESDLEVTAFNAADVLTRMAAAGNSLNLVILDACRNNAFQREVRSGGRGLAPIDPGAGVLVALAAAPGRVATDGAAENSPYALALADALREPGLTVEQAFEKARTKVESMTAGTQSPWQKASIEGAFYLAGPPPEPEPAAPVPMAAEPPAPVVAAPQVDKEVAFWDSVKDSASVAVLQAYLDQYPNGAFSSLARVLIEGLAAEAARERELQEAARRRQDEEARLAALTPPPAVEPARPGTPAEMVTLGLRYEAGDGLAKDAAKAADWYREASTAGSAEAKYRLGLLYYRGLGVDRNFGEAAGQILDAVKENHAPAVDAMTDPTELDDPAFLKAVQERLRDLGYYRSDVDGLWGPGTRNAVVALSRGDPEPVPASTNGRKRPQPTAARSVTVRGPNSPQARSDAGAQNRVNPQCSRWGKDFNNPGCAFGL